MDKGYHNFQFKRKRRKIGGGFQIIYTGFVLIMLSFFIMLTSFSTLNESHVMQFTYSFADAVSIFTGGLKVTEGKTILKPSPDIVDKHHPLAALLRQVAAIARETELMEVELALNEKGVVMTLSEKMVFETASASINASARKTLEKIAYIISAIDYPVRIEGHTDNIPITTRIYPSNWELSTARAVNVLRALIRMKPLDLSRLSAAGFSQFQPIDSNGSAEGRARNRRVEIVFLENDQSKKNET